MLGNKYNPDVGFWFNKPTYAQLHKPYANGCPPPDICIEQNFSWIEFIGIALPDSQGPFHQNPNPGVISVLATPQNSPNVRPTCALYFVYWDGTNLVYYRIDWNEHLVLGCGWTMELNDVLDLILTP
ncbi:5604_t:CDS:2 [Funneliformis geosporum]|uniref:16273_t:CDS:1 n=1 Tax=Funneliformis geosporum TaxID=1117311 RepID=A0A9W4WS44_9GLOM|nr:16273_t:CDS:2 [Funneliformis geosporum]CAI2182672.1 5604_t:CDS:2 [Funneliformis geosporum]